MSALVRSRWESAAGVHLLVMNHLASEWGRKGYNDPEGDVALGLDIKDAAWIVLTRELGHGDHGEPPDRVREYALSVAKALLGNSESTEVLQHAPLPDWLPRGMAIYDGFGGHIDPDRSFAVLQRLVSIRPLADQMLHVRLEYFAPPMARRQLGVAEFEPAEPSALHFLRGMPRLRRLDLCGLKSLNFNSIAVCCPSIRANSLRCLTIQDCTIPRGVSFAARDAFVGITQLGLSGVTGVSPLLVESMALLPSLKDVCVTACADFGDSCMEVFMCHPNWRARQGLVLKVAECPYVSDSWLWSIPRIKGHGISVLDFNLLPNMSGTKGAFANLQSLNQLSVISITGVNAIEPNDLLALATCFAFLKALHVKGAAIAQDDNKTAVTMLKEWAISTAIDIGVDEFADDSFDVEKRTVEDLP